MSFELSDSELAHEASARDQRHDWRVLFEYLADVPAKPVGLDIGLNEQCAEESNEPSTN